MATYCIPVVLQVQAETETEAHQIGEGAALHLQETYNDNGSIIESGALLGTIDGTAEENAASWRLYLPIHKLCASAGLTDEGGAVDLQRLGALVAAGAELERVRDAARTHEDCTPCPGDDYNELLGLVMNGAPDPWHLFYIVASDEDGTRAFIVSAQSGSEGKASELAQSSVAIEGDDVGGRPLEIEHCRCIGVTDRDIFERVGLLAS